MPFLWPLDPTSPHDGHTSLATTQISHTAIPHAPYPNTPTSNSVEPNLASPSLSHSNSAAETCDYNALNLSEDEHGNGVSDSEREPDQSPPEDFCDDCADGSECDEYCDCQCHDDYGYQSGADPEDGEEGDEEQYEYGYSSDDEQY